MAGLVLNSSKYGDVLKGGAGADTINAGRGPDVLTGGAGTDVFVYRDVPWNAGKITDFTVGSDKLDLSVLLKGVRYAGSDPIRDGYIVLKSDGAGGTWVMWDSDGAKGPATPTSFVVDLAKVSPGALSSSKLLLDNYKPGLIESVGNWLDSGSGIGNAVGNIVNGLSGSLLKGQRLVADTWGDKLTGGLGNDTLVSGDGNDVLTGGLGSDVFVFDVPNASHVTDFRPGTDKLDVSQILDGIGYNGANPLADGTITLEANGKGGTDIRIDMDGAGPWTPWHLTTLDEVGPSRLSSGDWIF